jgi:hypothetical protein
MSIIARFAGGGSARRHYRQRGYQVFRGVFPVPEIETIAQLTRVLVPFYSGELRRQDGRFAANEFFPGTRLVRNSLLHPHVSLPAHASPVERLSLEGLIWPAKNSWGDFLIQLFDKTSVQLKPVNEHFSVRILT